MQDGNPIIKHKFTCDPTALVHKDTVFLFTGHDEAPPGVESYIMREWLCFSSADLVRWKEHPVPLRVGDFTWSKGDAYASKVIERGGKFYWYAATSHATINGKAIGVAVANDPAGPFIDALGEALINQRSLPPGAHEKSNMDPTVLIDDDEQAYIFWGSKICYCAKLKPNMIEIDGAIQSLELPEFEEGANIHKKNDWYYLSYGYGMPERVAYAMSQNINGPWLFKGILNELSGNCETNRPCIIDFKGNSYFIYHNGALKNGGSHRRSVCIDRLSYNSDNTINKILMTSEGVGTARDTNQF